jgi:uncharacterized protein HemY
MSLGRLYRRGNQLAQARGELSLALTPYRAMSMQYWLSKAEAALAELS